MKDKEFFENRAKNCEGHSLEYIQQTLYNVYLMGAADQVEELLDKELKDKKAT